jgi:hypothetical protein
MYVMAWQDSGGASGSEMTSQQRAQLMRLMKERQEQLRQLQNRQEQLLIMKQEAELRLQQAQERDNQGRNLSEISNDLKSKMRLESVEIN